MKKIWIYWGISLGFTLLCMLINNFLFSVPDIIPLEFARSVKDMNTCIQTIPGDGISKYHILLMNTIWDYGFLTGYSFLALFSFILFLDVFQMKVNLVVYILSFIAGILDAIENYFLIITGVNQKEYFSCIYFWAVRIKWAFAIFIALLILIIIMYGLIILFRQRRSK